MSLIRIQNSLHVTQVVNMKQVHLLSLFIFLLGIAVGITGVVLAIIFGVHKESPVVCPSPTPCAPSIPITCSAKPISIKTGINSTVLSWTPELENETSGEFKNASEYISKKVSRFLEGKNKNVLCYAVGVAVGNKDVSLLPSTTSLEKKLDSDTTFIDPNVVSDSLDWCLELNNTIPTHITTSTHLPSTSSNITTSTHLPSTSSNITTSTHLPSTSSNITTSTHLPSTSSNNTTQTKQTPFCMGGYKYKGDIAVAFELTSDTNSTEVETFVKILLNYKNNPYRNFNEIQIRLESYELSKNFHSPIKNAHIADGFNFIRKIENHGENVGAVILVGVSDKFVNEAKDLSLQLQDLNYHVFTVSIGSANNFSTLASNEKSSFTLSKPDYDFAVYISSTIGSFLCGHC
uniref:VWFA domain-containing protein n=1 Tax=Heterorhabditis bacteriophora TaxID=37862 RepID=A0A1I7XQJ9_HETBA